MRTDDRDLDTQRCGAAAMTARGRRRRPWRACLAAAFLAGAPPACHAAAPPQTPPYSPSQFIDGIDWDFDGLIRLAPGSDLWPMTWAADDNLYTSWGDGGGFGGTDSDGRVSLGFARIEGQPPNIGASNVWGGKDAEHPATFGGKVGGMLSVTGVLYAWLNTQNAVPWDAQLIWSEDRGASWQRAGWRFPGRPGAFSPATFLNFGRDYADASDDFVYFYGWRWGTSTEIVMGRVPRDRIRQRNLYVFFAGLDRDGMPRWDPNSDRAQAVFRDPNGASGVGIVFHPGIERYLLFVAHDERVSRLGVFDGPTPWGPWSTVAYYDDWGHFGDGEPLGYALPAKWLSDDGSVFWLAFSSTGELDSFNLLRGRFRLRERVHDSTTSPDTTSRAGDR